MQLQHFTHRNSVMIVSLSESPGLAFRAFIPGHSKVCLEGMVLCYTLAEIKRLGADRSAVPMVGQGGESAQHVCPWPAVF